MMNVLGYFMALAIIFLYETSAEDVKVMNVEFLKVVEHTFNSMEHLVLACPPVQQIRINSATWIPIADDIPEDRYAFDRTKHLNAMCRSFENCAFRPVAHTMDLDQPFEFLGKPIDTNSYKLLIKTTCVYSYFNPSFKTIKYSLDAKEKPTLHLGCGIGEQIRLSYIRAAGKDTRPLSKDTYCYKSVIAKAHLLCSGRKLCSVPWSLFEEDNNGCNYAELSVKYHCVNQRKTQFFDPLEACDKEKDVWNFALSAEEGAHVMTTAHAHRVLNVVSAVWESQQHVDNSCKKRDRTHLLKFLCQGQASCSFVPTRAAIGPDDRRCMDIVFGGIVHHAHTNFILRAHLQLSRLDKIEYEQPPYVHVTSTKGEPITMKCEADLVPLVAVALWGGEDSRANVKDSSRDFEKVVINGYTHHYKDFSPLLNKLCFGKSECTFNPLHFERLPDESLTSLPWYKGVEQDGHVLDVYYKCIDYSQVPSLVDIESGEQGEACGSFAQMKLVPQGYDREDQIKYPKEFIKPVALTQDCIITALLHIHGSATLNIANILNIEIPFNEEGGTMTVLWEKGELKSLVHVKEAHKDYVFEFIVGAPDYIQLRVNAYDNHGSPIRSTINLEAEGDVIDFNTPVNDLILALGNVTSLRAFYRVGKG